MHITHRHEHHLHRRRRPEAGHNIPPDTTGCVAGEVLKYNGTAGNVEDDDSDTNTTYSASGGITQVGTDFSLDTTGCGTDMS